MGAVVAKRNHQGDLGEWGKAAAKKEQVSILWHVMNIYACVALCS